jgi:Dipeptidase
MLFGKNSDRSPNEPQFLQHIKAKDYDMSLNPKLKLTYIEIPQVEHTYEVVVSRPEWMWGAEFGFNEFGLNIGNEAVFTKEKYVKEGGITGMDMLRLALERCRSAIGARDYIITLLEQYRQGGNCGYDKPFYYHNSFLIADKSEAYVLETAGKYWVWKKVTDYFAISNCLCLSDYDACHPDLVANAIEKKWCTSASDFDFVKCYSEPIFTKFAKGRSRRAAAMERLARGQHDEKTFIGILRMHSGKAHDGFNDVGSICMHAGGIIGDNTTASYVADVNRDYQYYYATGSSMPCINVFKPLILEDEMLISSEGEDAVGVEYWMRREKLLRYFISGSMMLNEFKQQARILEEVYIDEFKAARDELKSEVVRAAFEQESRLINRYTAIAKKIRLGFTRGSIQYRSYWKRKTKSLLFPKNKRPEKRGAFITEK